MTECSICYETGVVFDGKCNSAHKDKCCHMICMDCCQTLYNDLRKRYNISHSIQEKTLCPFCREDWTLWLLNYYDDEICEGCEETTINCKKYGYCEN